MGVEIRPIRSGQSLELVMHEHGGFIAWLFNKGMKNGIIHG